MMKEAKFYVCETCGNLVGMINESGVNMVCCGKKMTQIVPGTVEASKEKHIPVVTVEGDTVKVNVGSVDHPMTEEHLIEWVYLQTCRGGQRKCLKAGDAPTVTFALCDEKPIAVYAYCNLHGLWKTEL
ncbi:MAG: desulfoferrodoxin [Clostridia bacterium]|nr:desulfoferrodoxin [Clostridia bacterium]